MPGQSPLASGGDGIWVTLGAGRAAVDSSAVPALMVIDGKWRVDLDEVRNANTQARTGATPGLLGQKLHELGLTTALVCPGRDAGRAAVALADEEGIVDAVWTGGELRGRDKLRAALAEALLQHAVVLADLSGMDSLEAADSAIGEALALLPPPWVSLVVMVSPGAGGLTGSPHPELSPITMRYLPSPTGTGPGLLTSLSTRWEGLVTTADAAPTLLSWWDLAWSPPAEMTGRVIRIRRSGRALEELDHLNLMLRERHRLQLTAGMLYATYGGLLAVAALSMTLWRRRALRWLAGPALVGALFPVGLLMAPLAGPGQARQLLVATGVAVGGALGALLRPRSEQSLAVAMLAGAALIAADAVCGSPLMRRSAVGFSVVSGSRFYGIGNECVGILAAMATIGLGALVQAASRPAKAAALAAIAVALVVGMPWWGANWGGYMAISTGLVSMWVLTSKRRTRAALLGLAVVAVAAFLPPLVELLRPAAERSHIGSAAALLSERRELLAEMVLRKLQMNWQLAAMASWWWILAPLAGLAAAGMLKRGAPSREALDSKTYLRAGMWGAVVSAIVAMVLNDSGVVSMALACAVMLSAIIFAGARSR